MAFWTDNFLNKMRAEWAKRIVKIQYYASGTWYDALITSKEVVGNKVKIITQTSDNSALTITSVRLIDNSGEIAGQRSESIEKKSTQSVITLWEFPLYEVQN